MQHMMSHVSPRNAGRSQLSTCCVLLQDVSSIGCYLWDITLLFAQQQDNRELARQISLLQVSNPVITCTYTCPLLTTCLS